MILVAVVFDWFLIQVFLTGQEEIETTYEMLKVKRLRVVM